MKKDKIIDLIIDDWIANEEFSECYKNWLKGLIKENNLEPTKEQIKAIISCKGYLVDDKDIKKLKSRIKDWRKEEKSLNNSNKKKFKVKDFGLNVNPCSPFGR